MVAIAEIDCGQKDPSLKIEAKDSYDTYLESLMSGGLDHDVDNTIGHRRLKHHHHHNNNKTNNDGHEKNHLSGSALPKEHGKHHHSSSALYKEKKKEEKHKKKLKDLFFNPGIQTGSMHGMMIDAGSSGSRMHVYEFKPRILTGEKEITEAVTGRKLSYPDTNSRWTERLRPGIASFASLPDDQLFGAIADYLSPLLRFAETVLHEKSNLFAEFPVYLKGTAGLRMLDPTDRTRIISTIRDFFRNETYNKFKFENEFARVISGEEEAVYGWTGANFALGSLLKSSEGSGTVTDPSFTYGTVEMGGASSQIAFYRSNEDIMSNLFKLQIGQGKHWNVYTHSFLHFGIHEAWNRMAALLAAGGKSPKVENPCLAGGSNMNFETNIMFVDGHETRITEPDQLILENSENTGDYESCAAIASSLLHKNYNTWCNFSHNGDCSFAGVYQPKLPELTHTSGEFLAFSNYYDIFNFLDIPNSSSLNTLQNATMHLCSMEKKELVTFNDGRLHGDEALKMCFQATFALQMLMGYGFGMDDHIIATNVVNGHKIGWALGSMMYEINTLPWQYSPKEWHKDFYDGDGFGIAIFYAIMLCCILIGVLCILISSPSMRRGHTKEGYNAVDDVQMIESES